MPNPPTARPPSVRYAWYVIAILTLANISANVDQQALYLLVGPIKRDLGIDDVQWGYLTGLAFALFYAVLGLPIARWADRGSRRNIIAGGVTLWSVFTSLCAWARTYATLFAMRVGVGVGEATLSAPSVALVADYVPRERLTRAMSVFSLGIFFGSGVGYFLGGWIAGLAAVRGTWSLPVLGTFQPWQTVFLIIGVPGLVIALLFLTVREPVRRGRAGVTADRVSVSMLLRYLAMNRRTYLTNSVGFAVSAMVNFSMAVWLPAYFERTFGWTASAIGRTMGLLTMTLGVAGVLAGGWLADMWVRRGRIDGPLRVGMIGAAGLLATGTACVLAPSARLAVLWLAIVNVFAAFPYGAASAAAAEMAPAALRSQSAALYFFLLSLFSRTLGASSVGWITEYWFHDDRAVRYSMAIVIVAGTCATLMLFAAGLGAYRRTVSHRDEWLTIGG